MGKSGIAVRNKVGTRRRNPSMPYLVPSYSRHCLEHWQAAAGPFHPSNYVIDARLVVQVPPSHTESGA